MFELLVAAKLLLLAPQKVVGTERAKIEARLGQPSSVGTDMSPKKEDGSVDRVVTLDWADLRVRLFESPSSHTVALLGVTTTKDLPGLDTPVGVGSDRGTVLRELGGPAYEDQDQIVYALQQDGDDQPNDTMRFVMKDDRVIGIDWTFRLN
ncbi:MAG TPA: hypothetical protein VFV19_00640 [Candidatus Polarisedimenticolaceae bacterium]|nr:hypothetical protein [Candidatus Polarisedimenticolaceae bacterium]